ncbi:MAG: acylphosphatase [Nitrososphaerota archaeon]|jgi:acylphosphatase|nr:acylphosphatase [Nitrososphaerota archaeon]MDG6942023.1 acylphosphatase [Nitrososphaerota archaeon]MDG6942488.1 acylphosphatase [Nitrososphaerota archaeon]MDG6948275.1 acylphosphatase [Nitrososphaerota archaeon]
MAKAVRVRIWGLVHGVSFRASMVRMASDNGVRGWVRNLPDGSVEAFLEGDERKVQKMVEWARVGPARARVDRIEVEATSPRNHRDFRIHG